MKKICILTSGRSRGSNYQAIADSLDSSFVSIEFVVVTSNKAPIIDRCKKNGHNYILISARNMSDFENKVKTILLKKKIDLVVLAGFMKLLSKDFVSEFPVINIHPALLPKYGGKGMYGSFVHQAVFSAKEKCSGATVHFVNDKYDEGQIVLQKKVDIRMCKSADEVAHKVLAIEHEIYAKAIMKVLSS